MKRTTLLSFLFAALAIAGCNNDDCFDKQMKDNHSGICTTDCPGVCGCDGKTYCNSCEANNKGITVVHQGACK